jgi:glutamate/tyrosine decarboxylase-like PLP-dependent enzyme
MAAEPPRQRRAPLELSPDAFRELGHALVEDVTSFLETLPQRPVAPGERPPEVRALLPAGGVPPRGSDPGELLTEAARLLFEHSLFNGHPRFWGYITSSAAPIGALADLLAAAVNPNLGGWPLSPVASEIEAQTVRWIAELVGFPADCGGLLVSGGNMANFVCFLAARRASAGWDVRAEGMCGAPGRARVYVSAETHTWVEKAADLFGLGTDAIRWIETDDGQRMDAAALEAAIDDDREAGEVPLLVVGTGGSVSTGAIDPLPELRRICDERSLWLHVDGAYGAFAALLPDAPPELKALATADSVALDPHKWLYAPLEAGCALVRDAGALRDTFSYRPAYYHLTEDEGINYFEHGPQNSRGFRALKVWLALRQVGREGYERMIADDCALARRLYELAEAAPELEAWTHQLSITTFRYVPRDLQDAGEGAAAYLDDLNKELLDRLERGGEAFVSNAIVRDRFLLRACVVNFRTSAEDIEALPGIVTRLGGAVDAELRPAELHAKAPEPKWSRP